MATEKARGWSAPVRKVAPDRGVSAPGSRVSSFLRRRTLLEEIALAGKTEEEVGKSIGGEVLFPRGKGSGESVVVTRNVSIVVCGFCSEKRRFDSMRCLQALWFGKGN